MSDYCWRCAFRKIRSREKRFANETFEKRLGIVMVNLADMIVLQQGGDYIVEVKEKPDKPGYVRLVMDRTARLTGDEDSRDLFLVETRTGDAWELGRNRWSTLFQLASKPAFNVYE